MKNVLMIISGRSLGGTKQAFLDYARMLINIGCNLTLVLRKNSKIYVKLKQELPELTNTAEFITYHRSRLSFFRSFAVSQISRIGNRVKPDVIICHKPIDCYFAKEAMPSVKLIGIAHGFYTQKEANLINYSDVILAVSQAVKDYILPYFPDKNIEVIHNSVVVPKEHSKKTTDIPIIGTMCVFRRKKNIPLLLKACKILSDKNMQFELHLAGSGRQKLIILYHIYTLGLKDKVKLLGWVNDIQSFFSKLAVFVVSSNTETFNITLIEALAHKVPVVSTACGGPSEIILDKKSGLLSPVKDAKALANKLEYLILNVTDRNKMAEFGYQDVRSRFAIDIVQDKLRKILEQ